MSNDSGVWENCAWLNLVWLITWRPQGNYRNTKYFWTDVVWVQESWNLKSSLKSCALCFSQSFPLSCTLASETPLVLFYWAANWQRQLASVALLSDTFFLCTCLPCLICSFISGVSGAEKVSWSCSWFKKPILWLDRLLHCAAGQGTHNMARGQRETQARPCLEKFGVAFDAKSKGPNLISWWCVTLNMEKSAIWFGKCKTKWNTFSVLSKHGCDTGEALSEI